MYSRRYNRGVISIEILISLSITLMLLPVVYQSLYLITKIKMFDEVIQDEIATYQLRRKLLVAENFDISKEDLYFDCDGNRWHLYLNNNHLLLTPGSQFVYNDIDDINFSVNNNLLTVSYTRSNYLEKRIIGKVYEK
jgi:hypothetical protein